MTQATGTNAIQLLKSDHDNVKALFDEFEKTDDKAVQKRIVEQAVLELSIHAEIEEAVFYPAVREKIKDAEEIMTEADEEHHVAKVLIAELEEMNGSESHFAGKFKVLAENVRHHIEEEERDMLPAVEKTDLDLDALGAQLLQLKEKLTAEGVSPSAEVSMVEGAAGEGDSPAENAKHVTDAATRAK